LKLGGNFSIRHWLSILLKLSPYVPVQWQHTIIRYLRLLA